MAKPPITSRSEVVASKNQVFAELGGEAVILGMEAGQYFGLDEVGARIWTLLQEPIQVSAICSAVMDEYEVDRTECERDVLELLTEMHEKGLIDVRAQAGLP